MKPTQFSVSNGHLGELRIWLDTDDDKAPETVFGIDGPEFANYVYFTMEGLRNACKAAHALEWHEVAQQPDCGNPSF
jgi:hypothetical protein